jgi:hypothetical protein
MAVSIIGGGKQGTQRKAATCCGKCLHCVPLEVRCFVVMPCYHGDMVNIF